MGLHKYKVYSFLANLFISLSLPFFVFQVEATFNPILKPIISLCTGASHTCAVFDDYRMKCWGMGPALGISLAYTDNYGGDPSTLGDAIPFFDSGTNLNITYVTCYSTGFCILLNDGSIKCVGENLYGQAGPGNSDSPIGVITGYIGDNLPRVKLGTGVYVEEVIGGYGHTCIITSERKVKCFGWGPYGQLGLDRSANIGKNAIDMGDNLPFVDLGTGVEVASLHAGANAYHNCVILSAPANVTQRIKCWGYNSAYQLGYGDINNRADAAGEMGDNLPLVDLGIESRVKQITSGQQHTCVVLVDETLKCFGRSDEGQLGLGTTTAVSATGDLLPSVLIDSGKTIKIMSAGYFHTCAVYDNMISMKCWGWGGGMLGQNDATQRGHTPTSLIPTIPDINLGTGSLKIVLVQSGYAFNCVVFENSSVKCFGLNIYGQLAVGSKQTIGDSPNEMGSFLHFAEILGPNTSPTLVPTKAPIKSPTHAPQTTVPTKAPVTQVPTAVPTTSSPTISPTSSPASVSTSNPSKAPVTASPTATPSTSIPTDNPTTVSPTTTYNPSNAPATSIPTNNPTTVSPTTTNSPTVAPTKRPTLTPTTASPTATPTTSTPTVSPISQVASYDPPKSDCYMILVESECNSETNSKCGQCGFISTKLSYSFRVKVDFFMEGSRKFSEFESTTPKITTFRDALKALIEAKVDGTEKISISKAGDIKTSTPTTGSVEYDISFIDNQASKDKAKAYFASNPAGTEYVNDMNTELNKKMNTSGRKYLTGKINISNSAVSDSTKTGACGCQSDTSGSIHSISSITTKMWMLCCMIYTILIIMV